LLLDVDDDQRDRLLASLNESTRRGRNDEAKLVALLTGLAQQPRGLEGTGFDGDDLDALIAAMGGTGGGPGLNGDPDDVPEPPEEPVSVLGDLYKLGEHRLLCGDSTDPDVLGRLMDGRLADMIWTDPPYNVAVTGGTHDPRDKKNHGKGPRIANDAMGDSEFRGFLIAAFSAMAGHLRPGGAAYVCHADTEGLNFRSAFGEGGLELHQVLIWVKQQFVFGRSDYHWQHEPILYGWKPGAAHAFHGERNQSTTWNIDRPMRSAMEHPTQKPVDLVTVALLNSSESGQIVLDSFGGTGSTLLACYRAGRIAHLAELEPAFCDVICKRFEQLTGIKPERVLPDGTTEPVTFTQDHP